MTDPGILSGYKQKMQNSIPHLSIVYRPKPFIHWVITSSQIAISGVFLQYLRNGGFLCYYVIIISVLIVGLFVTFVSFSSG